MKSGSPDPQHISNSNNPYSSNFESINNRESVVSDSTNFSSARSGGNQITGPLFAEKHNKIQIGLRFMTVCIVVVILICVTLFPSLLPQEHVDCLVDTTFEKTTRLNSFFENRTVQKKAYLVLSGLLMDVLLITQFYKWIAYGKSWRLAIALSIFYLAKLIVSNLFLMRYPDGYEWQFPGFYSISVPYGNYNTFFFSTTVGLCMINFCEFKLHGSYKLAAASIVALISQVFLLISLRGHYEIDVFAGIIFGHYAWIIAERISWIIDVKIFRQPFHHRFPKFQQNCTNCATEINQFALLSQYIKTKLGSGGDSNNKTPAKQDDPFVFQEQVDGKQI